ncbi:anthranilate synthase component I family protein [Hydrogenothermus marinus]|uniref:Para-aminobenzoate synthetase component 1 n=1 Tax=Hydrogenothermus marinus TaxID=133270 RepID=A0A3M0BKK0_9AQUI|nr:anthranilate synthase component I family protein [Hydrogenothermus marinus]RMA97761.1 para-aminobenzoate synthetase component 1 [Hydrogenothermus marinus]
MEDIIYSSENGFFDKKGFYFFDKPIFTIQYKNNILQINNKKLKTKNPIPIIEKLIKGYFSVGFISYDFKEYIYENLKKINKDKIDLPLIYLKVYKNFKYQKDFYQKKANNQIFSVKYPDKGRFIEAVKKAKKYIEEGDIYQINLSHRIEIDGFFNVKIIFYNLTKYQPTPYLMLIRDKNFSIISASMELFLEKKGDILKTKPIKGTRPRGKTKEEDEKLKKELYLSEKERAENLMITDLMRNDLGIISEKVLVEKLFEVEEYKSLFQMSSTIKSKLKKDITLKDIIYATFPPGSVTGAPKKRAMEIIDQLEDFKRHIYCGSLFLIKPNMDFIMSVAIRQSIFQKKKCCIYVGAGIVADSIPEKEYEETILKAKANIKSI